MNVIIIVSFPVAVIKFCIRRTQNKKSHSDGSEMFGGETFVVQALRVVRPFTPSACVFFLTAVNLTFKLFRIYTRRH